jgi:hypothetical protein
VMCNRDLALGYADRGWHVFPVAPGGKLPAIPRAHAAADSVCRGECGRLGHGVYDATTDRNVIKHWWTYCPTANIGIACAPSGVVVIDLDTPKGADESPPGEWALPGVTDGADVLAVVAERQGQPFPFETFTVRTGRGGLHLYFLSPVGGQLRNTARKLGWLIDTRAAGGYVLAAGSTVAGKQYVVVHDATPARLPAWLAELIASESSRSRRPPNDVLANLTHPRGYARAVLRAEVQGVLDACRGERNNTLNRAAYALGRLVAGGALPLGLVFEALTVAGEAAGLSRGEAAATVNSGLRAGATRPRRGGAA